MSITVESIQETGGEASHRRFLPCWIDMRLGTGFASFGGEEVGIVVRHSNLEGETLIPRDMFGYKAAQERAMNYSFDLKHFSTHKHVY